MKFFLIHKKTLLTALFWSVLLFQTGFSTEISVREISPFEFEKNSLTKPNQIPHSEVVRGYNNIKTAWLGGATNRYAHGVLGDTIEASVLYAENEKGKLLKKVLPKNRVFEDLKPRIIDINGDKKDDIAVIESDVNLGASLSIYTEKNGKLELLAATPFLGRPNRWLNPVGAGDFDGDGKIDIALVATPHIGGILRLYRLDGKKLKLFAEYEGVSTHSIGSTEIGLGTVVKTEKFDLLLLPDQYHTSLLLLKWTANGIKEITRVKLEARLDSSLIPVKNGRYRFRLMNKKYYELKIR